MSQKQDQLFQSEGPSLKFGNDIMKTGLNYTVRHGKNYATSRGLECGMHVALQTVSSEFIAEAIISHILVCTLKDIPKEVLSNEHDPACHNPFLLYDTLVEVYPDVNWTGQSFVTCIGFSIIKG